MGSSQVNRLKSLSCGASKGVRTDLPEGRLVDGQLEERPLGNEMTFEMMKMR